MAYDATRRACDVIARSEATKLSMPPRLGDDGLLRFARNDEGGVVDQPLDRTRNRKGSLAVHATVEDRRTALGELCRKFGVARLDVFGSAARGADFDAGTSDLDFLVVFEPSSDSLVRFLDFHDALEALLGRPVDLVDRKAIEASRNTIRRRHILDGAEPVYVA